MAQRDPGDGTLTLDDAPIVPGQAFALDLHQGTGVFARGAELLTFSVDAEACTATASQEPLDLGNGNPFDVAIAPDARSVLVSYFDAGEVRLLEIGPDLELIDLEATITDVPSPFGLETIPLVR